MADKKPQSQDAVINNITIEVLPSDAPVSKDQKGKATRQAEDLMGAFGRIDNLGGGNIKTPVGQEMVNIREKLKAALADDYQGNKESKIAIKFDSAAGKGKKVASETIVFEMTPEVIDNVIKDLNAAADAGRSKAEALGQNHNLKRDDYNAELVQAVSSSLKNSFKLGGPAR